MNLVLYTKRACPLCEQAKTLLKNNNTSYTEIIIGEQISREDVLKKFPWAKVAPIIVDEDKKITVEAGMLPHYLEHYND